MSVSTPPPPALVRETAAAVVNRPYYKLDFDQPADGGLLEGLLQTLLEWLGSILGPIQGALETLGKVVAAILRPLIALFQSLYAVSPLLAWSLAALLAGGLILLGIHRARNNRKGRGESPRTAHTHDATRLSDLEAAAARAAADGNYMVSVRTLFAASLLFLEQRQDRGVDRGATNREYLLRFRGTAAFPLLAVFVELIDTKWYGPGQCNGEDVRQCKGAYRKLLRLVVEGNDAEHA